MSKRRFDFRDAFFLVSSILLSFVLIKLFVFSNEKDPGYHERFIEKYGIFAIELPNEIDFAGEEVPLHNFDIAESLDKEFLINTYWQSQTVLFIKKANRFFPIIEPILEKHNIPDDFKYIALIESGLANVTSPAGAKGYWQFLKGTGKEYGLEITSEVDERFHLEKSTEAACKYFSKAYDKFQNWTIVATSYNMGRTNVIRQINRQKSDNYYDLILGDETGRYIFRILAVKLILNSPEKYGFNLRKKDLYPQIPTYQVKIDSSIADFADFAHQNNINYKILKYFNPWLRENYLNNPSGKTYFIDIPKKSVPRTFMYDNVVPLDSLN
jgi:peptidoglycan lytic transglycosylase D